MRYRLEEIVDGKLARVQRSHRLCTKDKRHPTLSHKSVRRACDEFMATINAQVPGEPEQADLTIGAFWEHTYWPFVQENCKPSTYLGYQQVWNQHLKDQHDLARISQGNSGKSKANGETKHYTLEEIENIISALVDHVDCQLIMAVTFFLSLRKGQIAGLQWADIDGGYIHIRRAITRGHITTPKTKKSVRSLPLIQPVKGLLILWRAKCNGDEAWVFQRNLMTVARKTIRPTLTKATLEWKGFHAGRRGFGTVLRQIIGNSTAGHDVLGHEDEALTKDLYEGKLPEVALAELKLLEAGNNAFLKEQ